MGLNIDQSLLLEILSVVFSLVFLILVIRENIWCWPFGIISSALSIVLFYQIKLYSESILYIFYVIMGFYGWYRWQKFQSTQSFHIRKWRLPQHLRVILIGILLMIGLGYYFDKKTDAAIPYADAFSTMFSFIATYLEAHKVLSTWIYWILINGFTVGLYWYKGVHIYAGLMVIYFVFSFIGWYSWNKSYEKQLQPG